MNFDHLAEKHTDRKATTWLKFWTRRSPEHLSMRLAKQHRPGNPISACLWKSGAFNICYRVRYDDGPADVIVRFAALSRAILRREKVQNEVATMRYLRRSTSIPVPEVFGHGICWAGPYIVMQFVEGVQLSELLRDSEATPAGRPVLNPRISERSLRWAYREMAAVVLELSRCEFDAIGALEEEDGNTEGEKGGFRIARRPLTMNMNELMASANLPEDAFPSARETFPSARSYFQALALQHLSQLKLQQRGAIRSEEDCRRKFTARCLFLDIVTRKLFPENENENPSQGPSRFHLYCDDLRPSNVLIDMNNTPQSCVAGVTDWEFTYAAPKEFTSIAPWWLLLQSPEDWEGDLHLFLARYIPRFRIFLDVLRDRENDLIAQNLLCESKRLSPQMEHSMDEKTGLFWICLAARYSALFDEVYWEFIDERFFGEFTSLEERVRLLSREQREEMEELVRVRIGTGTAGLGGEGGEGVFEDKYPVEWLLEM